MPSVGERIRAERESRNTSLDDMSEATGIGQTYLESLEKGDYQELPGPAFGKLYIRAYAEVLGFDPKPWIEDYDRESRHLRGSSNDPTKPAPPGSRPMAAAIARWRESKMSVERATAPADADADAEEEAAASPPDPESEPEAPVEATPRLESHAIPPVAPTVRAAQRRMLLPILGIAVLAVALGFVIREMRGGDPAPKVVTPPAPPPRAVEPPKVEPSKAEAAASAPASDAPKPEPPKLEPPKPAPPASPPPVVAAPKTEAATKPVSSSSSLTVTEYGVGKRIVNLQLEGPFDHFSEGDRVSFATRVLGGQRGNVIRHVWIYEGRAQQQIALRVGGADYRTHTNKTVGKPGAWAVEARDDKGNVLARVEFTVDPKTR